jgi:hypothetical protein
MDDELKRCPFCGASAAWLTESGFMECGVCTATGTADGAEGWNRRPIEDALRAERDAAVARAEAAEGLIGRRGAIKVTGNRNDGWRGDLVDPDDNGHWFRTAGYDSRDAVVVTLVHWAVVNDVAVVAPTPVTP